MSAASGAIQVKGSVLRSRLALVEDLRPGDEAIVAELGGGRREFFEKLGEASAD